MNKYHKIQTIYKRKMDGDRSLLEGQFSEPEFEYLFRNRWTLEEKLDGMNIRVMYEDGALRFGGKTDRAQLPAQLLEYLETNITLQKLGGIFNDSKICLYGEGCGPKIQKGGGNYFDSQTFVLFDVLIEDTWLKRDDVLDIGNALNLNVAPLVSIGSLDLAIEIVRDGLDSKYGDFRAEGLICRPLVELRARSGKRIITKIKGRDFK